MAYGSPSNTHELSQLRGEITSEIHKDADHLSQSVFGPQNTQPDLKTVSNDLLEQVYRKAYESNNREFLISEAHRDPNQFLKVSQSLGVTMPPPASAVTQPFAAAATQQSPASSPPPAPVPPVGAGVVPGPSALAGPPAPPAPLVQPQVSAPMPFGPIPAMQSGGIVDQPTVALIGEAGPEAVVPLTPTASGPNANLPGQPQSTQDLFYGTYGAGGGANQWAEQNAMLQRNATHDEIVQYIRQAAQARNIDPDTAVAVALHEGTNPKTGRFDNPAQEGVFTTGRSYWPFQLHYGGAGTPYAAWGNTAGMGNEFTQQTGWQPGDPRAWQAAVDFALDQTLKRGWYPTFYGSVPAGVAPRQGLPAQA